VIEQKLFGILPDGRDVYIFRINAPNGTYAEVLSYGATLQSVVVPDAKGGDFLSKQGVRRLACCCLVCDCDLGMQF